MRKTVQILWGGLMLLAGGCALDDAWPVHSAFRPADGSATQTEVHFITDRQANAGSPGNFSSIRAGTPTCGTATLNIPAAPVSGTARGQIEQMTLQNCATTAALAAEAGRVAAVARRKNCHNVLLFVHGFHSGFDAALLRAGQIATDTQYSCIASAFSWTSAETLGHYDIDVERSFYAQPLLRSYLRALSDAGLTVDIIGHSMGARMVLAALADDTLATGPQVGEMILAAPDIGAETGNDDFLSLTAGSSPRAHRISVYVSRNDAALRVSQGMHGGTARLGLRAADADYTAPGIDIIDASSQPADITGHNYYAMSYEVLRDMARTLRGDTLAARMTDANATLRPARENGHPTPSGSRTPRLITRILLGLAPLLP